MQCPVCGGERLAVASLPGDPGVSWRVCLTCAAFWATDDAGRRAAEPG